MNSRSVLLTVLEAEAQDQGASTAGRGPLLGHSLLLPSHGQWSPWSLSQKSTNCVRT